MQYLHTIYCDDIRTEVGNKLSLMGMYSSHLYVESFPATLPRLGCFATYCEDIDAPLQDGTLTLLLNGQEIVSSVSSAANQKRSARDGVAPPIGRMKTFLILLTPLQLEGPSLLEARMTIGETSLQGTRLHIQAAPSPEATPARG